MNPNTAPSDVAATPEDLQLVSACISGEPGAWEAFVHRFAGLFVLVVERSALDRRLHLSSADRDEAVAEIVDWCMRDGAAALRGFAGRASLATYLTVVARRVVARLLLERPAAARVGAEAADGGPAAVADTEQSATQLHRLDAEEAILIRLHHLERRSYGEISRITGMPLGAIGPALSRARAKMRG